MFSDNFKLAIQSLRSSKWRSFFTMFGVIIGVFSVAVTVSVGIGIRQQITNQIKQLGPDLITVIPGKVDSTSTSSLIQNFNVIPSGGGGTLTIKDLTLIGATKGVNLAVPMAQITGPVVINGATYNNEQIIATTDNFPLAVNQSIAVGQFFTTDDPNFSHEAVIGQNIANQLFKQEGPIGQSFEVNGQQFQVQGVLSQFSSSPLTPVSNYNNAIFIPFAAGSQMSGNQPQIYEIFAKPNSITQTNETANAISSTLAHEHGSQDNFTVLEQKQILAIANNTLNVLTTLIAAVAAISLFVGGIGIMNIMLVAVVERTREIGIRKAIGATNRQILSQFLIESAIIGLFGGIIGILLALFADVVIEYFSTLKPAINWQIVVISIAVALLAGIIFGAMPALRASRKDPIDSLRHE